MGNILVIEDNADLANVLLQLIEHIGYVAHAVESGEDGLNYLHQGDIVPDAILCDLTLPSMGGLAVLQYVRQYSLWAQVHFVAMSGKPDDKEAALSLGADDYLVKPFDLQELVRALQPARIESN